MVLDIACTVKLCFDVIVNNCFPFAMLYERFIDALVL